MRIQTAKDPVYHISWIASRRKDQQREKRVGVKRREGRCKEGAAAREERGSRYVWGGEDWSNIGLPRIHISPLLDQQLSYIFVAIV